MVSTWVSGMIIKFAIPIILFVLMLDVVAAEDAVSVFLKTQFKDPLPPKSVATTGEVGRVCAEVLGRPYSHRDIRYWGDSEKRVWVLAAHGKHGLITAGVVVESGRILKVSVLTDREQRGRPIRSRRFLRQFKGIGLRRSGKLDRGIDAITGATISSTAMRKIALLALRLDGMRRSKTEKIAKDE